MARGDSKLWPDISSPLARRILTHIFNRYSVDPSPDVAEKIRLVHYEAEYPGIGNLWGRLVMTDIAVRLAGRVHLPDVYAAMPGYAAWWYRMFRPKTLEQQVDQVIEHLDWFVSPKQYEPSITLIRSVIRSSSILAVLALLFGCGALFSASYGIPFIQYFGLFLGVTAVLWRFARVGRYLFQPTGMRNQHRMLLNRNANALFHYLRREFSDTESTD